jgi:hypothetical protein
MRPRSTSRNFCVLPLATSLCVLLSNQSFSLLLTVILTAPQLSFQQLFFAPGWVLCFPRASPPRRQTYSSAIEFA